MRILFSALTVTVLAPMAFAHDEPRVYRNENGECVVIDQDVDGNGVSSSVSSGGGTATATAGGGRSVTVMSGNGRGSSAVAGSSSSGGRSAAIAAGSGDCVVEESKHGH